MENTNSKGDEMRQSQSLDDTLMQLIDQYANASDYTSKMTAFKEIWRLADEGFVGGCFVVGAAFVGVGPCGGDFLEKDRARASQYLKKAKELGDPIAAGLLKIHHLE